LNLFPGLLQKEVDWVGEDVVDEGHNGQNDNDNYRHFQSFAHSEEGRESLQGEDKWPSDSKMCPLLHAQ
jgi:hypothetical protein